MRPMFRLRDGRAQARAMKRANERVRADRRRERPTGPPMLVAADAVLAPVESILAQIELRGQLRAGPDDEAVFQAWDGAWYPVEGALEGLADFFEQWATRNKRDFSAAAVRIVAARIGQRMPLDEEMLDDVRAILPAMRRIAGLMSPEEAKSLIQGTQIKAELDALADGR